MAWSAVVNSIFITNGAVEVISARGKGVAVLAATLLLQACANTTPEKGDSGGSMSKLKEADQAYSNGNLGRAAEIYEEVVETAPPAVDARFRLAVIAYGQGDLEKAETRFQEVLRYEPDNKKALYNLSMVHLQQSRGLLERYRKQEPLDSSDALLTDLIKILDKLARREDSAR